MPDDQKSDTLSEREREVLELVATGATNRQVGRKLSISPNTVKVHLRNIFEKLEVESRTEATLLAIQENLIEIEGVTTPEQAQATNAPHQPPLAQLALDWRLLLGAAALALVALAFGLSRVFYQPAGSATPGSQPAEASQRWTTRAVLPSPRAGLAVGAHQGKVYAIGGENAEGLTGRVDVYDPARDEWSSAAEKPTAVTGVEAAIIGGKIYVPGGCDARDNPHDVLEVYGPEGNQWSSGASLPTSLCRYALSALEGKLYVFGGWDGNSYVDAVHVYDPDQDRWTAGTPMPTARADAAAAPVEGRIYVVGGFDGRTTLTSNEVYEPSQEGQGTPWREEPPLPSGRRGSALVTVGDILFMIGGAEEGNLAVLQYNLQDQVWKVLSESPLSSWRDLGAAPVGTKIYAVGGHDGTYLDANQEFLALFQTFIPGPVQQ